MNDADTPRRAAGPDEPVWSADGAEHAAGTPDAGFTRPGQSGPDLFGRPGSASGVQSGVDRSRDPFIFENVRPHTPPPRGTTPTVPSPAAHHSVADDWYRDSVADIAAPDADQPRRHLRSSIFLTLASAILPGAGLLGAPRKGLKTLGGLTAGLTLALVAFIAYWAVTDMSRIARFAGNETFLANATIVLAAAALCWVTLIVVTHVSTRPQGLRTGKRALGALVVTVLAFGVAAPTAVAARYSRDAASALDSVLQSGKDVKANNQPTLASGMDPWANQDRVNILLLGGDGDASRASQVAKYSIRTDTIMVASIDTKTGNTTLIQIPRNVQHTPFPEGSKMAAAFPNGFRGDGAEGEWYINTIWQHVELDYPNLMSDSTYRGADALKEGVEGVTGLKINQFVLLNIDGLQALITAMGGVTVNINQELAVGGDTAKGVKPSRYLQPGENQHLNGFDAMWYARSRYNTDDYNRMARQSCLINAIVDQANPQTLLTNFEPIIKASADMLATDITDDQLSAYIDLAFRVKDKGTISRLVFSNGKNGYSYNNPDFEKMRSAVAAAIAPQSTPSASASSAAPVASPSASKTATAAGTPSSDSDGVHNVADACEWQGGN